MTMTDELMNHIVGDRCPADPCASKNGLKMRTYAVVLVPTLLLAYVSFVLQAGTMPARLFGGLAGAWLATSILFIPRRIAEMEPCDEVDSHYGEDE